MGDASVREIRTKGRKRLVGICMMGVACVVFFESGWDGNRGVRGEFDGEVCMDECMRRLEMVLYTQKSIVPHSILSS